MSVWLVYVSEFTDEREAELEYQAKRLGLRILAVQVVPECIFKIEGGTREELERLEAMFEWIYQVTEEDEEEEE